MTLIFILLAILGLSFLIFIHELGHYWMARRVGMRVDTFSIGFGKPAYSWKRGDTSWQIGWIPFGGFVKIAGSETDADQDPYEVADGFFGRPAIDRIKVLLAGPAANILFAFLAFTLLWAFGGRQKNFSEFTPIIGWVDPQSDLYAAGIRPGDEVTAYNYYEYQSSKDHLYAPMTSNEKIYIQGNKVDYATGEKTPFELALPVYPHPLSVDSGVLTSGVMNAANYIVYDELPGGVDNPLPAGSPVEASGIRYGDRVFWVDGELIFSGQQLNQILNNADALLTVQRGKEVFLRRVPRVEVQELKLDTSVRDELIDWQFEAHLNRVKTLKMLYIPYNLTNDAVVENRLRFIDKEAEEIAFPLTPFSVLEQPLEPGDKILAVDGQPIQKSYQLLDRMQKHLALVIVERNPALKTALSWKESTEDFDQQVRWSELQTIVRSIGRDNVVLESGSYALLKPIEPKMRSEIAANPEQMAWTTADLLEKKKEIEKIEDPERRHKALTQLASRERQLLLGIPGIQDRQVQYNPNPFQMFGIVFEEIWRTLVALFTGMLSPKWISGPVGIVQVVQEHSMAGIREALFWLGAISLNLGILNLLPIPVLDGGAIIIHSIELVTRKRLNPKILEKVIIPFALLLICFFVFLTFNDLSRIFGGG